MARSTVKSLKDIVGKETYALWISMLKTLVPEGRTHRLAVVVAGMAQYAAHIALKEDHKEYEEIFCAWDYDDPEGIYERLEGLLEKLLKDAKVRDKRVNSRGQDYSISGSAIMEYEHWENMPWE